MDWILRYITTYLFLFQPSPSALDDGQEFEHVPRRLQPPAPPGWPRRRQGMQRRHSQPFVHVDDQLPAIVVLGGRVSRSRRDVPQPEREPAQPQRHRRAESQEAAEVARRAPAPSHRRHLRQRQDGITVSWDARWDYGQLRSDTCDL